MKTFQFACCVMLLSSSEASFFRKRKTPEASTENDNAGETPTHHHTITAIRSDKRATIPIIQLRMKDQQSRLARHLPETNLTSVLLKQQEATSTSAKPSIRIGFLGAAMTTSILMLGLTMAVVSNLGIPAEISWTVGSFAAVLPWTTLSSRSSLKRQGSKTVVECLSIMQLFLYNPHIIKHVNRHVLPWITSAFQSEIWRRFWQIMGHSLVHMLLGKGGSLSNASSRILPAWSHDTIVFIDTSIRRRLESTIKKLVQSSMGLGVGYVVDALANIVGRFQR